MENDSNRIIGIIIVFAIIALLTIASKALQLADSILNPEVVATQPVITPKVSLPNPQQYYFIECAEGEIAMVFTRKNAYSYICEDGKWKGKSRL